MNHLDDDRAGGPLARPAHDPSQLLQVRRESVDGAVVVHASGEVDMTTQELLDRHLRAAEHQVVPPAPVVLDLSGVVFLASMGLTLLAVHRERCAQLGSRLVGGVRYVPMLYWTTPGSGGHGVRIPSGSDYFQPLRRAFACIRPTRGGQ